MGGSAMNLINLKPKNIKNIKKSLGERADPIPFTSTGLIVDHRLGVGHVAEPGRVGQQHLVRGVGMKTSNVDVGGTRRILEAMGQGLPAGRDGRDGAGNGRG